MRRIAFDRAFGVRTVRATTKTAETSVRRSIDSGRRIADRARLGGGGVILRPAVQKRYLELTEPNLHDQVTDVERILAAMDDLELRVDLAAIRTLGRTLRANDFKVTAVIVDDILIEVEPGDTSATRHGIAFDLGTTTVVATLLDLSTGTPVAVRSMLNKQQPFGADVITRISASRGPTSGIGLSSRTMLAGSTNAAALIRDMANLQATRAAENFHDVRTQGTSSTTARSSRSRDTSIPK